MGRKKKKELREGKQKIVAGLLEEYEIESEEDIQDALADLLGPVIQSMLEGEMEGHLSYKPYKRTENDNARNGTKSKRVRSKYGEIPIDVT